MPHVIVKLCPGTQAALAAGKHVYCEWPLECVRKTAKRFSDKTHDKTKT